MKALLALLLTLAAGSLLAARPAAADGIMVPTEDSWRRTRERSLIEEPEQKAVVFYHGGTEDLVISPGFRGRADRFAWVVPVPSRPRVRIVEGALFHELTAICFPRPPAALDRERAAKAMGMARPPVVVLERRKIGAYDVSVLAATDGKALMRWLAANRYHLPERAQAPVAQYVREGWTFVACRIKDGSKAVGLRTGTLAPLRLTFPARRPVYPMRLSAANPGSFETVIYLIQSASDGRMARSIVPISCPGGSAGRVGRPEATFRTMVRPTAAHPTLAGLVGGTVCIYVQSDRWHDPEDCTEDYVWELPGTGRTARAATQGGGARR